MCDEALKMHRACLGSGSRRGNNCGLVTPASVLGHLSHNQHRRQWYWWCHSHVLICWGRYKSKWSPSFLGQFHYAAFLWCELLYLVLVPSFAYDGQLNWNWFSYLLFSFCFSFLSSLLLSSLFFPLPLSPPPSLFLSFFLPPSFLRLFSGQNAVSVTWEM